MGVPDCRIGRAAGNETDMEGLLSRTGAELATGSLWVALQPASRVIERQWVHIYKISGVATVKDSTLESSLA